MWAYTYIKMCLMMYVFPLWLLVFDECKCNMCGESYFYENASEGY